MVRNDFTLASKITLVLKWALIKNQKMPCQGYISLILMKIMYRNLTDDVDEDVLGQTFGEFGSMEKVKTE